MKQTLIGQYLLHNSFSSPAHMSSFGTHFADHYRIFYRPHALYVSMLLIYTLTCYSVNCKTAKDVSLPKIRECLLLDFTSFTGGMASRVQKPNFFAVGK